MHPNITIQIYIHLDIFNKFNKNELNRTLVEFCKIEMPLGEGKRELFKIKYNYTGELISVNRKYVGCRTKTAFIYEYMKLRPKIIMKMYEDRPDILFNDKTIDFMRKYNKFAMPLRTQLIEQIKIGKKNISKIYSDMYDKIKKYESGI